MRVIAALFVILLVMAGCSQTSSAPEQGEKEDVAQGVEETPDGEKIQKEVSVPANVPAYTLTKDREIADPALGLLLRDVAASTDVTSEEDLEAITRELWADTNGADVLQLMFYPNEPGADTTGTGMAFISEQAARTTIRAMSAQGADPGAIEADVRKTMGNDGIYIIPTEEMVNEIIEEECAKWDTTTLGTPPPEWNCKDL